MKCSDCHNSHGTIADKLVDAQYSNLKCFECHANLRGPLLWEHPPVVEECLTCHTPHNTSNIYLVREIISTPLSGDKSVVLKTTGIGDPDNDPDPVAGDPNSGAPADDSDGVFTGVCEVPGMPPFTKVQALASDSLGRLHVLDNFAAAAHVFTASDGAHVESYGGYGTTNGLLRVPMDVCVSATDMAIVTAGDGDRVEIFTVPQ